jgi:hypothetical protein
MRLEKFGAMGVYVEWWCKGVGMLRCWEVKMLRSKNVET